MRLRFKQVPSWRTALLMAGAAMMFTGAGCDDSKDPDPEGCTTTADCPGNQVCNAQDQCVDPDPEGCTSAADCPGDEVCNAQQECVPPVDGDPVCGDGVVEGAEECDEGEAGNDGTVCNADCTLPRDCGNGELDPGEDCDEGEDGNDGVTCNDDCTWPDEVRESTYLRWNAFSLVEPSFHGPGEPGQCGSLGELVQGLLDDALVPPAPEDGEDPDEPRDVTLNIMQEITLPLRAAGVVDPSKVHFPLCVGTDASDITCTLDGEPIEVDIRHVTTSGTCFARVPAEAGSNGWFDNVELEIDSDLFPVEGEFPCITGTASSSFAISLAGYDIPLNGMSFSAELDVDETAGTTIPRGMLRGFLTTEAAAEIVLLGVLPLPSLLNSGEGACYQDVGLDVGPDGEGGTAQGWWFYAAYQAAETPVTE